MSQADSYNTTVSFPVMSALPPGMTVRPIVDDANAPALKNSDWAIVDLRVTELEYGGVYLVHDHDRAMIWQVLEAKTFTTLRGEPAVILAPLNKAVWDTPRFRPGPAQVGWVLDNMIGKIVGLYEAADAPVLSVLA